MLESFSQFMDHKFPVIYTNTQQYLVFVWHMFPLQSHETITKR